MNVEFMKHLMARRYTVSPFELTIRPLHCADVISESKMSVTEQETSSPLLLSDCSPEYCKLFFKMYH